MKWYQRLAKWLSKYVKTVPVTPDDGTKPNPDDGTKPNPDDGVKPEPPPVTPPPATWRKTKIYESPRKLKIAALIDTPRGMIATEYDTFSRKRSVLRLLADLKHALHDGREETIQAPVESGDLLIFPTERHKEGLIVLDRLTLRKLKGITPKHEICIAGGTWNDRPVVASNAYPNGNPVMQDALSGAVLKVLSVRGNVTSISGEMCTVRTVGNGDNGLLNWRSGLFEPMKCTVLRTWWGSQYVGTSDRKIVMINGAHNIRREIPVGGPVYSMFATVKYLFFTVSKPNRLYAMDITGNVNLVMLGLQADLGWFGLPITTDAAGRVCWAEWDPERELSIVWRMEQG